MNLVRKIYKSENFWPLVVVIGLGLLAARHLFLGGYFNMHDDLHMMRQLQLEKCLLDGQIPCRWVPDMGYGFGYPLFNYYPPLPYLVGQGIRFLGFSFITTSKMMFAVAMITPGIFMYLLARDVFSSAVKKARQWSQLGGILAAAFYTWAPYHSVDIYVRGAMNEAWALIFFPSILWTSYRLIHTNKSKTPWIIGLALSWFGLLMSHNLMVIIFAPLFAIWTLAWLVKRKNLSPIRSLSISGILSLGLAAFFTIPVLAEKNLVRVDQIKEGYYNYIVHFVNLKQLLVSRFWGYGPSVWLQDDGMPFQIGHLHWIIPLLVISFLGYQFIIKKNRKLLQENFFWAIIIIFTYGWFAAFMTHSRSHFIWEAFDPIAFLQFPWRFLGIVIFAFSFVIGVLPLILKDLKLSLAKSKAVLGILILGLIIFNFNYFQPEAMGPLTDEEKFTGKAWDKLQTAGIYDYLPITAQTAPKAPRDELVELISGKADLSNQKEGTNWAMFDSNSNEATRVRLNILDYPEWTVFIDDQKVEKSIDDDTWGRIHFTIPEGKHHITARLLNTQVRTISNYISAVTWTLLLAFIIRSRFSHSPKKTKK